jgi:TolB protein
LSARLKSVAVCLSATAVAVGVTALPTGATASRDHRPILFERQIGPSPQIATVDPRDRQLRTLTDFKAGAREAQWAPNGGRIVFAHQFRGRPGTLFTMRAGGKRLRQVSHACRGQCLEDFEPAWSNDGRTIVFDRAFGPVVDDTAARIDLMLVDRNGTDVRVLKRFANRGKRRLEPHGADFSPDDRLLAFTLVDVSNPAYESAIFTYTLATGEIDRVTPWRLNAGNADWSADGRRILFNSNYLAAGPSDLYTIGPDGSALRRLTNYPGGRSAFAPTWSPSNRRLAFTVASRGVPPHAVVMKVGGDDKHRVTPASRPGVVLDWG